MLKDNNLQNVFMNTVRREKTPLTVFLISGIKLQGIITWFDSFCILLKSDGREPQLVFKHAISTIAPSIPINLSEPDNTL